MLISQNIKQLIYEIADISSAISDAITPGGLGKVASVAKKVAGAAQETDVAKGTRKILDTMDAARHADSVKSPGNMSPAEFDKMLDARKAAKAAKAVHAAVTNSDHPKPHMLASKWATDEHGMVKGTKLTPDQYTAHRIKLGGVANPAAHAPAAHAASTPSPLKISEQSAAKVGPGEVAAATAPKPTHTWQAGSPEVKAAQKAADKGDEATTTHMQQVADKVKAQKMDEMHKAALNPSDNSTYGKFIKPGIDAYNKHINPLGKISQLYNSKYNRPVSAIKSLFN
jgi:hypothetical protein